MALRVMAARFKSRCACGAHSIRRGDEILYDRSLRRAWLAIAHRDKADGATDFDIEQAAEQRAERAMDEAYASFGGRS